MADNDRSNQDPEDRPGLQKDPDEWVSGDDPMTGAQASYLETLARQAGETIDTGDLTKAEASQKIDVGSDEPWKRSRSTTPLIPGTIPELECCQNDQPLPAHPVAGTFG